MVFCDLVLVVVVISRVGNFFGWSSYKVSVVNGELISLVVSDASFQKKAFWLTFPMSGSLKYESEFFMCMSLFEKNLVQSSEKVFPFFFLFFYAECVFLNTFLAGMNFIRGVAQTKSSLDFSVSLLFAFFPTIRQGRPENEEPGSRRSRAARRKFLFVLFSDYS